MLYFASKMFFVKAQQFSDLQILNQYILLILLVCIFRSVSGMDAWLCKLSAWIKSVIEFVSSITLEIYLVQIILIPIVKRYVTMFPINWLALTGSIVFCAWILYLIINLIVNKIPNKIKTRRKA